MPTPDKKYSITIGMSIVPADAKAIADFGLRYGDADLSVATQLEAVFNEHADAILAAMKPLRDQLVAIGIQLNPPPADVAAKLQGGGRK